MYYCSNFLHFTVTNLEHLCGVVDLFHVERLLAQVVCLYNSTIH
jgi:hypothetical protein